MGAVRRLDDAHDLLKQRVPASEVMTRRYLGPQCKKHAAV